MKNARKAWVGAVVLAAAMSLPACGGGDGGADAGPPQPDAPIPTGTFSLSWSLSDGAGTIDCGTVKAVNVVATLLPTNGAPGVPQVFPCADGAGTTQQVAAQSYDVKVELKNSSGQVMATVMQSGKSVTAGGDTPLDPVAFTVSRTGGFTFRIDVGTTMALNCPGEMDTPAGAGIDTLSIELRDSAGACVPTEFSVEGEAMPRAAACPVVAAACVENDKTVTVSGVTAGDYSLAVVGLEGAEPCYDGTASFTVSGGDVVKALTPVLINLDMDNMNCVLP